MTNDLQPGFVIDGYRIEELIGRGGMGAVYRARDHDSTRSVALKLVRSEYAGDPLFRARFKREVRLMRQLSHPHILALVGSGESDGMLFVAMPFIEGTDLEAVIAERGALHPGQAADVIAQVASALDAAAELGLVHRDVKPGNILLELREGHTHAYLADFGLSKHVTSQSGLTTPGTWVGSVDYAAPEQIQAQPVDSRTDVYALGAVLHQALTGEVPFPQVRDVDKLLAHVSDPPPRPSAVRPGIPPAFDAVVARAMAKLPTDRYQRATDLGAAALAAAVGAGPPPDQPLVHAQAGRGRPVDRDAPTIS